MQDFMKMDSKIYTKLLPVMGKFGFVTFLQALILQAIFNGERSIGKISAAIIGVSYSFAKEILQNLLSAKDPLIYLHVDQYIMTPHGKVFFDECREALIA